MKKLKAFIIATLLLTFLASSYVAIAAEYGSKSDPLVSLSYIEDVILPQIKTQVSELVTENSTSYMESVETAVKAIENEYSSFGSNEEFIQKVAEKLDVSRSEILELNAGDKITLSAGSEILLREGNLTAVTNSFLNATTAEALLTNGTFTKNNLYYSLSHGQEITVSEDSTVIVFGNYILS